MDIVQIYNRPKSRLQNTAALFIYSVYIHIYTVIGLSVMDLQCLASMQHSPQLLTTTNTQHKIRH